MKKILKALLATVLLLSVSTAAVCAEGSPSKIGEITYWEAYDENDNKYSTEDYYMTFQPVELEHAHNNDEVQYQWILDVNNGQKTMADLLKELGIMPSNGKNVVMFQPILDLTLKRKSDDTDVQSYKVKVTFEVPNLIEGMGDILVYHHSSLTGKDELIKPLKVDYEKKELTVYFDDLSPITVIGMQKVQKPVDTSAKDYTGLFAGIALAAAALLIAINKKEKTVA